MDDKSWRNEIRLKPPFPDCLNKIKTSSFFSSCVHQIDTSRLINIPAKFSFKFRLVQFLKLILTWVWSGSSLHCYEWMQGGEWMDGWSKMKTGSMYLPAITYTLLLRCLRLAWSAGRRRRGFYIVGSLIPFLSVFESNHFIRVISMISQPINQIASYSFHFILLPRPLSSHVAHHVWKTNLGFEPLVK